MESSKIKQVIIMMLAIVNGFLLILVVSRGWQSAQAQEAARTQVVTILSESGIAMELDALPKEVDVPSGQVVRDPASEMTAAVTLLGEDAQVEADRITYVGQRGTARFYANGEFFAQFLPDSYPVVATERETFALNLLAEMGFLGQIVERGADQLVVEQLVDGMPVFSCQVILRFDETGLREIAVGSSRLVGVPQMRGEQPLITVPMALLRLLDTVKTNGDLCSNIDNMTLGYLVDTQSVPARLVPTWQVTAMVGADVRMYTIDGVTGSVKSEGK